MQKEEILARIGGLIARFPDVRVAYVYGSFPGREDYRDIDVGIFVEPGLPESHRENLVEEIGLALEREFSFTFPFDVRVLNDAPLWFQYEVIAGGRPVFARNEEERFAIETDVLVMYLDMKYTWDLFDSGYLARA